MAENKKEQKKPLTAAEKRRKAQKRKAWLRAGIQFIFFLSMPGAFVAGFSGIKHLFLWIGAGEPLQVDSFVLALIGLCAFTILFGRFFCGYVCAFGGLGDGVFWLSGVVQKEAAAQEKAIPASGEACAPLPDDQVCDSLCNCIAVHPRLVRKSVWNQPLGCVLASYSAEAAGCRIWHRDCPYDPDCGRNGDSAALLLPIPVPDGSCIFSAADLALCAAET